MAKPLVTSSAPPVRPLPRLVTEGEPAAQLAALEQVDAEQWSALHWLSRSLHAATEDLDSTLDAILARVLTVIPAADSAGINLLVRGRFEPQAVRGAAPPVLDALQQRTGIGPCIDAARQQRTISVGDIREAKDWVEYAALAERTGVLSMLCLPLYVDSVRLGSLSLFGGTLHAFDGHATLLAELFAAHAALALSEAQRATHLQQAMNNRDVIGQAKGILMERHRVTADRAFVLLSEASQTTNTKLVTVAEIVTSTGALPGQ